MFDVGWSELVVIGVVALVVIGPKELPGVIRSVGRAVAKLRTMAGDFRGQFDDAMREAELSDVKKTFTDAKDMASGAVQAATNPLGTIKDELVSSVSAINESAKSLEAELGAPMPLTTPDPGAVEAAPTFVVEPPPAVALPPELTAPAPVEEAPKPKRRKKPTEAKPSDAGDAA
jgi:sec-independent protein translocase protein TatB